MPGTVLNAGFLTMINPSTGWFKIIEYPNVVITYMQKGEEIMEVMVDKSSATMSYMIIYL